MEWTNIGPPRQHCAMYGQIVVFNRFAQASSICHLSFFSFFSCVLDVGFPMSVLFAFRALHKCQFFFIFLVSIRICFLLWHFVSNRILIFISCHVNESNKESIKMLVSFRMALGSGWLRMRKDWREVAELNENFAYNTFTKLFNRYYTSSFSLRVVKQATKKIWKPRVTRNHLRMIQIKNRLYQSFRKSRGENILCIFKLYRNHLNSNIRRSRNAYYINIFVAECLRWLDVLWKRLNCFLNRSRIADMPSRLIANGVNISDIVLSNKFSNFFVNVGKSTYNKMY